MHQLDALIDNVFLLMDVLVVLVVVGAAGLALWTVIKWVRR